MKLILQFLLRSKCEIFCVDCIITFLVLCANIEILPLYCCSSSKIASSDSNLFYLYYFCGFHHVFQPGRRRMFTRQRQTDDQRPFTSPYQILWLRLFVFILLFSVIVIIFLICKHLVHFSAWKFLFLITSNKYNFPPC